MSKAYDPDRVTDHALVRWLERVHDIDMELYRRMLHQQVQGLFGTGVHSARIDKWFYVFADGKLVTVQPAKHERRITAPRTEEDADEEAPEDYRITHWKAKKRWKRK